MTAHMPSTCSCEVTDYGARIVYCPLHASAQDLLDALTELSDFWAYGLGKDDAVEDSAAQRKRDTLRAEELGAKARAAIDKAIGKTS